jgi:hypothetical protein
MGKSDRRAQLNRNAWDECRVAAPRTDAGRSQPATPSLAADKFEEIMAARAQQPALLLGGDTAAYLATHQQLQPDLIPVPLTQDEATCSEQSGRHRWQLRAQIVWGFDSGIGPPGLRGGRNDQGRGDLDRGRGSSL